MSEESTSQTAPKPEVNKADLEELQKNLLAQTEEKLKTLREESKKEVQSAREEERDRVAKALGLRGEENQEALLLEKLLEKPSDVLAAVSAHTEKKIEERLSKREQEQRLAHATVVKAQQAASKILKERPDIRSSEEARELVDSFYDKAPDSLDEEERVKWAVNKFDLLMEKNGSGSAQERVSKAASPTSDSSVKTEADMEKTQAEVFRSYTDARIARYKQLSGGKSPR